MITANLFESACCVLVSAARQLNRFASGEIIVQRERSHRGIISVLDEADRDHSNPGVIGQGERFRARLRIEAIFEQVAVRVNLVLAVLLVPVGTEPGERRALDKSCVQMVQRITN
jgi:hypothetical protein